MHRKKAVKITIFQLKKGLFRFQRKAVMLNSLLVIEEPRRRETSPPKQKIKGLYVSGILKLIVRIIVMDYFGTLSC